MARQATTAGAARGAPAGRKKGVRATTTPRARKTGAAADDSRSWVLRTTLLVVVLAALRLVFNALGLVPVHFDEAQYWAYGQELAWGYFSKPPLVAFVIRLATDLGGDTLFWLRVASPFCHAVIALGVFAVGARLFGGRVGFWSAAGYSLAPGVIASSMLMSTDPVLMLAWVVALYAMVRAAEDGSLRWWAILGAAVGIGLLAKYTMIAFAAGVIGFGLVSARTRDVKGIALAAATALAVFSPNILWNVANGFATVGHVAEDADPGGGYFNPLKLVEFTGAQFGVIGPVFFLALLLAALGMRRWRGDWRLQLLAWQTYPLLFGMIGLSFVTRAQPNWAAPAYVAGTILAAHWLVEAAWLRGLRLQLAAGLVALVGLWGGAWAYATWPTELPRAADPFKKMRITIPFCSLALGTMAEEGAQVLLSNDRRRLSECMFEGGLTWDEVAIWNPKLNASNHHELVATLRPGDERPMVIAVMDGAEQMAAQFDEAYEIDAGSFRTHSDRETPYRLWFVQGFRGYRD